MEQWQLLDLNIMSHTVLNKIGTTNSWQLESYYDGNKDMHRCVLFMPNGKVQQFVEKSIIECLYSAIIEFIHEYKKYIERLQEQLKEALKVENYELAQRLKKKINKL